MASRLNPWKIQGYKPGQNVICRIAKAEPGGYAVIIPKDNLPGYLPSDTRHNVGDEVLATFVCVDKNRMLLSERFTHGKVAMTKGGQGGGAHQSINWEEQLNELDSSYASAQHAAVPDNSNQYLTGPLPAQVPYEQQLTAQQPQQYATGPQPSQYQSGQQQPWAGPTEPHQSGAHQSPYQDQQYSSGPQQAYAPPQPQQQQQPPQQYDSGQHYAQQEKQYLTGAQPAQRYADGTPSRRFELRRAIDLIMPPIEADSLRSMRIGDYDVEWLITQLEGGMHTGCVKAACESRLSRAAMLLYKGRAVGCIYGCKSDPTTKPTEESLQAMLADLESPDTVVSIYDLPENITLAMSSLFLGYPVERNDDYNAIEYMDYIGSWLGQKNGTATLAISLTQERGTCLGYIYKGDFAGSFYVEGQTYRADKNFVYELLQNDQSAALEVSILPPEMHASAVRFGFSLSMARTRKLE